VNPAVQREARMLAAVIPAATTIDQLKQFADKATSSLGRLEASFDSTMDRIRQRFTLQMRIWTVIFSLIMVMIFHLDAATLYARLSADNSLRASVSGVSETMMKKYLDLQPANTTGQTQPDQTAGQPAGSPPAAKLSDQDLQKQTKKLADDLNEVRQSLAVGDLRIFEVHEGWYKPDSFSGPGEFFRILATAGLLSLGAPFWFNALKTLSSLRSATAQKKP
jgi:hypothetical protein